VADQPSCSCGDASAVSGPDRIIVACAGVANVGQISNIAALELSAEGYGAAACVALLATGAAGLKTTIRESGEVVVIDGCPAACGRTIAEAEGITPGQHIVVTALGIAKAGPLDFSDDDVETVVAAAWEGAGREKKAPKDCGCGCGGSC
jgi:uncharacterized metal-binding protein